MSYHDPGAVPGERQWDEFIDAIVTMKRVVLTKGSMNADGTIPRDGYVAVFTVDEVTVTGGELTFKFLKRLVDLR